MDGADSVSFDSTTRTFTIRNASDLSPAGSTYTDYTITVTGAIVGDNMTKQDSASFVLRLLNPCIDSNFVQVVEIPLDDQAYTLF